jgi:hypothetical protein
MKIIEGLKKIKELQRKAEDLRGKVGQYHVHMSTEQPVYGAEQKATVQGWMQSHSDIMKEILDLRLAIQRTNLAVEVSIDLSGKSVTKSIAAWIHRRRDLAEMEAKMWGRLNDRGLTDKVIMSTQSEKMEVKVIRYYDPKERDNKLEEYTSEPHAIDARLEIVNATTDLQ